MTYGEIEKMENLESEIAKNIMGYIISSSSEDCHKDGNCLGATLKNIYESLNLKEQGYNFYEMEFISREEYKPGFCVDYNDIVGFSINSMTSYIFTEEEKFRFARGCEIKETMYVENDLPEFIKQNIQEKLSEMAFDVSDESIRTTGNCLQGFVEQAKKKSMYNFRPFPINDIEILMDGKEIKEGESLYKHVVGYEITKAPHGEELLRKQREIERMMYNFKISPQKTLLTHHGIEPQKVYFSAQEKEKFIKGMESRENRYIKSEQMKFVVSNLDKFIANVKSSDLYSHHTLLNALTNDINKELQKFNDINFKNTNVQVDDKIRFIVTDNPNMGTNPYEYVMGIKIGDISHPFSGDGDLIHAFIGDGEKEHFVDCCNEREHQFMMNDFYNFYNADMQELATNEQNIEQPTPKYNEEQTYDDESREEYEEYINNQEETNEECL